jgi:bifunctional non-homologous end joining protein LigD
MVPAMMPHVAAMMTIIPALRRVGAEGIVSKRLGSLYRGRGSRDWLKTKCHETGVFVITGFQELGEGRLEALFVAEERNGDLAYAGQVRFGLAGKGLWSELDRLRVGPSHKGVAPIESVLWASIRFFGRHKGGFIRDGVLLGLR